MSGALGRPHLHLRRTPSTNTRARDLAGGGAPHGTLVTATEQTAGRGREGRTWVAPAGRALVCSIVLRSPPALLPLAAAVAVAEVAGAAARVKWPNDVLLGTGKVAGILIEGRPQEGWAVLGIGINVAVDLETLPPEVAEVAATMGRDPSAIDGVTRDLLGGLERWLGAPDDEVLVAYGARDALAGRGVRWSGGTGTALGVDPSGGLRVREGDGTERVLSAGEVHLGAEARWG